MCQLLCVCMTVPTHRSRESASDAWNAPGCRRTLPYLVVCAVTAAKGVSGSGESIVAVFLGRRPVRFGRRGRDLRFGCGENGCWLGALLLRRLVRKVRVRVARG